MITPRAMAVNTIVMDVPMLNAAPPFRVSVSVSSPPSSRIGRWSGIFATTMLLEMTSAAMTNTATPSNTATRRGIAGVPDRVVEAFGDVRGGFRDVRAQAVGLRLELGPDLFELLGGPGLLARPHRKIGGIRPRKCGHVRPPVQDEIRDHRRISRGATRGKRRAEPVYARALPGLQLPGASANTCAFSYSQPVHGFEPLPAQADMPALEREILARWQDAGIFERSLKQTAGGPAWIFYEGPPTANGTPGVHHVEARTFKDLFPRFKTMQGFHVPRKGGWDCHGLPVEVAVEKELGFTGKRDIEAYGVAEFNARCRESVLRHVDAWLEMSWRMGYWADTDNAYRTMDARYVESFWWSLKTIYEP